MTETDRDDMDDETSPEERERRRATLARAKAGIAPLVPPEDVTYEDEPDEPVRVPMRAAVYRQPEEGGSEWATDAARRDAARQRASVKWTAETACEREAVPAEPSPAGELSALLDAEAAAFSGLAAHMEPFVESVREIVEAEILAASAEVALDALLEGRTDDARRVLEQAGVDGEEAVDDWTRDDSAGVSPLSEARAPAATDEEMARRRESLARAKAGLSPDILPEDVTYDDEGPDGVSIPVFYPIPGGASWNPPIPRSAEEIARHEEYEREYREQRHRELVAEHGCVPCFEPFNPRGPR